MDFFITPAWAQAATGTTAGTLSTILPLVLIFVVFYFLLIRPQTKRAKEHREMVAKLAPGDEIVTNGGILGRITEVGEQLRHPPGLRRRRDPGPEVPGRAVDAQGHVQGRLSALDPARAALSALEGHHARGRHGRGDPARLAELVRRIPGAAAVAPRPRGVRRRRRGRHPRRAREGGDPRSGSVRRRRGPPLGAVRPRRRPAEGARPDPARVRGPVRHCAHDRLAVTRLAAGARTRADEPRPRSARRHAAGLRGGHGRRRDPAPAATGT